MKPRNHTTESCPRNGNDAHQDEDWATDPHDDWSENFDDMDAEDWENHYASAEPDDTDPLWD